MYSHTKKVGSVGRYGARIGRRIRDEVRAIEDQMKSARCIFCGEPIKRKASGIWYCKFCKKSFAGGAYVPSYQVK